MNTLLQPVDITEAHPLRKWAQRELLRRYGSGGAMLHGLSVDFSLFLVYSFTGWLWESTVCSLTNYGKLINRGFLNGPYCPIYGCGGLLAVHLLSELEHPAARFLASGTLCCALEYATSWGMEKLFHARWWDYSDKPFNLNGRIYLNGFLAFGAASALLVDRIDPALRKRMNTVPPMIIELTAGAAWLAFAADSVITLAGVTGLEEKLQAAEETLEAELEKLPVAEHAHAAYEALQRLNAQQRRMLSAFPKLHLLSDNDRLTAIRRQFHNLSQRRESDSSLF